MIYVFFGVLIGSVALIAFVIKDIIRLRKEIKEMEAIETELIALQANKTMSPYDKLREVQCLMDKLNQVGKK